MIKAMSNYSLTNEGRLLGTSEEACHIEASSISLWGHPLDIHISFALGASNTMKF
jgi:hypothetical protein